jgi:plastocyanin
MFFLSGQWMMPFPCGVTRLQTALICCLLLTASWGVAIMGQAADSPIYASTKGEIAGVVRFTGTVPPPTKIITTDGGTILHSDLIVDPKTKGLRFVVAVLEDAPAQPKVEKAKPVIVDQREMVFVPRVVAVQHGQAVRFENNDNCNHSVMATSTKEANQFNLFVTTKPYEHVFEPQKHPVQIGCSLHPWMRAWVFVVPHPWFAVSDTEGKFKIDEVPAGKYTLWLRHPDTGLQERRTLAIEAGQKVEVQVNSQKIGP